MEQFLEQKFSVNSLLKTLKYLLPLHSAGRNQAARVRAVHVMLLLNVLLARMEFLIFLYPFLITQHSFLEAKSLNPTNSYHP